MDIVDASKSGKSAVGMRRTRRIHAEDFKQRVVDACREPGASLSGVALKHGVNANLARRWSKERPPERMVSPPALLPVTVCEPAPPPKQVAAPAVIEIVVHGARIIVPPQVDAGTLREVLRAVGEVLR